MERNVYKIGKELFITSDEEIKDGDYAYYGAGFMVQKVELGINISNLKAHKKIILTTDQNLIKDGVQAIDDEFLKWFVKNPSCEEVEVEKDQYINNTISDTEVFTDYKIIIPKEEAKQHLIDMMQGDEELGLYNEHKQETLEEVNENKKNLYYYKQVMNPYTVEEYSYTAYEKGFIEGYQESTKWQDERMYSEEEVLELLTKAHFVEQNIVEWFEQFKKK
jgi:hypothetical protein